ncbi:hypothetical protein CB1_000757048 [Camelus ferus]|nr:hypothetical protein CB1_000757048 [Camelus ferus]
MRIRLATLRTCGMRGHPESVLSDREGGDLEDDGRRQRRHQAAGEIGNQKLPDGSEIPLPPLLLGKLGSDPQKKTACICGHLDVQPAALEDGWDSKPFTLVE